MGLKLTSPDDSIAPNFKKWKDEMMHEILNLGGEPEQINGDVLLEIVQPEYGTSVIAMQRLRIARPQLV